MVRTSTGRVTVELKKGEGLEAILAAAEEAVVRILQAEMRRNQRRSCLAAPPELEIVDAVRWHRFNSPYPDETRLMTRLATVAFERVHRVTI